MGGVVIGAFMTYRRGAVEKKSKGRSPARSRAEGIELVNLGPVVNPDEAATSTTSQVVKVILSAIC